MKKLTAILILMSIIVSMFSFSVSAAESGDVNAEDYGILSALAVINADSWADGTVVTRAEFIQLCVNLTGCSSIKANNTEPVFTDITVSHWAYDAIMYAYSMGYVAPYTDGSIKPESPVTYGEAVQIMVNFLGYQIMAAANNNGDVIQGYYKTGYEIGLLDDVTADSLNMPILKSAAVRMAYNALMVDLPIQYFSNNNIFFNVQEDRTLLRVVFDAYRGKGVVMADDFSSLSHELARENYLTIDNVNYFSANVDTDGLLGCNVLYYYTQAEDEEEKVLVYIKATDNEIVEINAENLSYSNMVVKSTDDLGKKTSYNLGRDSTVIWNTKILKSSEYSSKFNIKSGKATLIDNDSDGTMEVVILESQDVYRITVFDTVNMELRMTDGTSFMLEDYRNYRVENEYGEKINPLALHTDDIVSVYNPGSKDYTLVIRVCKKQDSVTVNAIDSANNYLTLNDGTEFRLSNCAIITLKEILLGESYEFYIDEYGHIVYGDYVRSNQMEVVYLMDYSTGRGIDDDLRLKVMRMDESISVLYCAAKVKIRDTSGVFSTKNAAGVMNLLNQGGTQPKRQAIMIRVNANGMINEIYMLATSDHTDLVFHEIPYSYVKDTGRSGSSGLRWYQTPFSLSNAIQFTTSTQVMAVPHADRTDDTDEEYFVTNYTIFKTSVYYAETGDDGYFATPIGLEKNAIVCDYFVWEYPKDAETRSSKVRTKNQGIVTKISTAMDENGDYITKITYASTSAMFGNTITYKQTNGSLSVVDVNGKAIEVGDVISIGNDDYLGYATEYSTLLYYDCSDKLIINEGDSSKPAFYAFRIMNAKIEKKNNGYAYVEISATDGTKYNEIWNLNSAVTINCNVGKMQFTEGRSPDSFLAVGDSCLMILGSGLPETLLIYE